MEDLSNLPEIDFNHFDAMTPAALAKEAKKLGVSVDMEKHLVIEEMLPKANEEHGSIYKKGVLDVLPDGWGFLRNAYHASF